MYGNDPQVLQFPPARQKHAYLAVGVDGRLCICDLRLAGEDDKVEWMDPVLQHRQGPKQKSTFFQNKISKRYRDKDTRYLLKYISVYFYPIH